MFWRCRVADSLPAQFHLETSRHLSDKLVQPGAPVTSLTRGVRRKISAMDRPSSVPFARLIILRLRSPGRRTYRFDRMEPAEKRLRAHVRVLSGVTRQIGTRAYMGFVATALWSRRAVLRRPGRTQFLSLALPVDPRSGRHRSPMRAAPSGWCATMLLGLARYAGRRALTCWTRLGRTPLSLPLSPGL